MRLTLLLGALFLGTPALAQTADEPAAEEEPPPPPTMDFSAYDSAMASGKKAAAADELLKILDDEAQRALHATAWMKMAELMESYDFKVAALHCWANAIATDPIIASNKLGHAIELADAVGDDTQLAMIFAENMGANVDAETRSKMGYLAARELLRQDELGAAYGLLLTVDKKSSIFPDAELLKGVVLSMQGKHNEAVGPMLTAQAIARTEGRGPRYDAVVALNVARTYFGAENWNQAIFWFDKIPRDSVYWPEAHYEKGWAYFRADDMPGTLATLLNHKSGFFEDWFFPEADLLRAYGEFMMCKFGDASKSMDRFVERYQPLKAELDSSLASYTPEQAWEDGIAMQQGRDPSVPKMVLRSFELEERFAQSMEAVTAADEELTRLGALDGHKISDRATGWVQGRKDTIIAKEGGRVQAKAKYAQSELADMLEGIELTRLDLLNLETEMYEKAAATGKLEFGDKIGKLRQMRKNRKGFRVWPYNGEFWADELGWYKIDARPDCPEAMAAGEKK